MAGTVDKQMEVVPELIWRMVDDNAVLVSPEDGEVHVLSHTGTVIWQLLADKRSVSEIESFLVTQYIVSPEKAHSDVVAFMNELKSSGLLR